MDYNQNEVLTVQIKKHNYKLWITRNIKLDYLDKTVNFLTWTKIIINEVRELLFYMKFLTTVV